MKADGEIANNYLPNLVYMNPWTGSYVTADYYYPQAYSADMLFPRYVWITYARDFDGLVNVTCNGDRLTEFMDGVFTLLPTINSSIWNDGILLANKIYVRVYLCILYYTISYITWFVPYNFKVNVTRL